MELHQLQYVLAVARYHNFTIAAESCYISQSSLSQQIANLEKELGVCLFKRSTRTLQITEAGDTFVRMAAEILGSVDRLGQTMSDYAGFLRGTINIGAITALEKIRFSDMVSDFYAAYPNLTLNIYHGKSLSLLEALEKRTVDVAFLPAEELECFRMDGLRCVRLTKPIYKRIVMAMLTKNTQSHLVDAFIRFVEKRIGQQAGE